VNDQERPNVENVRGKIRKDNPIMAMSAENVNKNQRKTLKYSAKTQQICSDFALIRFLRFLSNAFLVFFGRFLFPHGWPIIRNASPAMMSRTATLIPEGVNR
jgi:hypothetical protein